jgi:Fe-S oxidoreductase
LPGERPLDTAELDEALSNCISCKACKTECPSNVDMALLKAEMLYARYQKHRVPLRTRLLSRVDRIGRLGSIAPGVTNWLSNGAPGRAVRDAVFGLDKRRPLPAFATRAFNFARSHASGDRGTVRLWLDCFARYYEPNIAHAAVRVLEAAGYRVDIASDRVCCGRPAFSLGLLDVARQQASEAAALLARDDAPIVALEPSCYSMLAEDFRELGIEHATEIAKRTQLFESFLDTLMTNEPNALPIATNGEAAVIHSHCHAKATTHANVIATRLAKRFTAGRIQALNTGCCGMAGAFGALSEKYDLSVKIAEPLVALLDVLPDETAVIASGTSCRHQIEHLTPRRPLHMAEWIASKLAEPAPAER